MNVLEAIHTRVSVSKVKPDPVPHELIEKLLSAAVQAPNHYNVHPWRFIVLTGKGREHLGEVMAQSLLEKNPDLPPGAQAKIAEKEKEKPLRAPLLIAVGVDNPSEAKVVEVENIAAVSAAIQNLLLAAHAEGLGAKWRTGNPATDAKVKKFLGLEPDQHLIGFLYIGYPEAEPMMKERPSFEDRTVWIN